MGHQSRIEHLVNRVRRGDRNLAFIHTVPGQATRGAAPGERILLPPPLGQLAPHARAVVQNPRAVAAAPNDRLDPPVARFPRRRVLELEQVFQNHPDVAVDDSEIAPPNVLDLFGGVVPIDGQIDPLAGDLPEQSRLLLGPPKEIGIVELGRIGHLPFPASTPLACGSRSPRP